MISDIAADDALKALLTGKVFANTTELKVYGQNEQPNTELGTDYIRIMYNGNIRSLTNPIGVFEGNLALSVYSESNTDGTAKKNRMKLLLAQVEELINNKSYESYTFKLSTTPITPVTTDTTIGYAFTTLNVEWWTY